MKNTNGYQREDFEPKFCKTRLYNQLLKDFDLLDFEKSWEYKWATHRQAVGTAILSVVPFYYLEYLVQSNPAHVYDIGCGWNIFKKYIPNIIGIAAEDPNTTHFYGDIHDLVDDDFVQGHRDFFECAFSINALHFHPMSDLQKIVKDFYSMLAPGARGFLALNAQRMIERDADNFSSVSMPDLDQYIRDELSVIDINFMVFDVDLSIPDEQMNGNIRLVMQKKDNHP